MNIISDYEAARIISTSPGRYACYLGAGASYDAGIPLANAVCDDIARLKKPRHVGTEQEFEIWRNETFHWDQLDARYSNCLQALPNLVHRIDYFRKLISDKKPTFVHHALALLMRKGVLKRTVVTTNFDKLVEYAFILQGQLDCQPIRVEEEAKYWVEQTDKFYVLKIHGDCDTYNIANTHEETVKINDQLHSHVRRLVSHGGLVVIGTAGNERSIQKLFDELEGEIGGNDRVLEYGILWAVHLPGERPKTISEKELRWQVNEAAEKDVNKNIRQMIERAGAGRRSFCFFPIWGASRFFEDLVYDYVEMDTSPEKQELAHITKRYLDHDTRLNRIFSEKGLTSDGVKAHIKKLRQYREQTEKENVNTARDPEFCLTATHPEGKKVVRVFLGDITDNRLLKSDKRWELRQAVVSPEDTCVSAGGGVAYKLARQAGLLNILNELDKLGKVSIGKAVVTSAGNLPVAYIFHAAAGEVKSDGEYYADTTTVFSVIQDILQKANTLGVPSIWCPLLASGRGGLSAAQSLQTICDSINQAPKMDDLEFNIVVWWKNLEGHEIREIVKTTLEGWQIAL